MTNECHVNAGPLDVVTVICPKTLNTGNKNIKGYAAVFDPFYCFAKVYTSEDKVRNGYTSDEKILSEILPGAIAVHGSRMLQRAQLITPYYVREYTSIFCACVFSAPHESIKVVRVNVQKHLQKLKGCDFRFMIDRSPNLPETFLTEQVNGTTYDEGICNIKAEPGETIGIMCAPFGLDLVMSYYYRYDPDMCFEEVFTYSGRVSKINNLSSGFITYPSNIPENKVLYENLFPRYVSIPRYVKTAMVFSCRCIHKLKQPYRGSYYLGGTMTVTVLPSSDPTENDNETIDSSSCGLTEDEQSSNCTETPGSHDTLKSPELPISLKSSKSPKSTDLDLDAYSDSDLDSEEDADSDLDSEEDSDSDSDLDSEEDKEEDSDLDSEEDKEEDKEEDSDLDSEEDKEEDSDLDSEEDKEEDSDLDSEEDKEEDSDLDSEEDKEEDSTDYFFKDYNGVCNSSKLSTHMKVTDNSEPIMTPIPTKTFDELTLECPDSGNCSIYALPQTVIKLKCKGADKEFDQMEKRIQCFTYVMEAQMRKNVPFVGVHCPVQLESLVPGAVSTYKNEDGYAKLLTPSFVEKATTVLCTCGYDPSKPDDLANLRVVDVTFPQRSRKTPGCSFQTNADKSNYLRFSMSKSHLTKLHILDDKKPQQECTVEASSNDVVGFQCGPTVEVNMEDENGHGTNNLNHFMVEPYDCFDRVNDYNTLDEVVPDASSYPKYNELTQFGRDQYSRYLKLGNVKEQTVVTCTCRYLRNGREVYTGTMIVSVKPSKQTKLFKYPRSVHTIKDDANHDEVVNTQSTEDSNKKTSEENNNDNVNNDSINNDSINNDSINNDSINNDGVGVSPINDDFIHDGTCGDGTGDCERSNPNDDKTSSNNNLSVYPGSTHTSYHSEHSKNEFVINDAQNVNIFLPQVNNYNINHGTISGKNNGSDTIN